MSGLLLDTCTFLWLIGFPERLPRAVCEQVTPGDTQVAVSTASLWEVLIKHGKGRIGLDTNGKSAIAFLVSECKAHRLDILPVTPSTLEALERLPDIHKDPFDRLLICQAIEHGLTLITPDPMIRKYPIRTFW